MRPPIYNASQLYNSADANAQHYDSEGEKNSRGLAKRYSASNLQGRRRPLERCSYRATKLIEDGIKILEKVLERRIRQIVELNEMQFGFTSGRGTTDVIFIVRQMIQRKERPLYYAFVDLEKAYDRIPREVARLAFRDVGVDEKLMWGYIRDQFFLFIIVMDKMCRKIRGLPWELLYADDLPPMT